MLRVPRRLPIPSRATATWKSLWVSTPRMIAWASVGMHRLTFPSPHSADEHRSLCVHQSRGEADTTAMSLPFAGKRASIKSRPSRSGGGEGSGPADGSPARHSYRPVKIWVRPAGGQSPPIFSQWFVDVGEEARLRLGRA